MLKPMYMLEALGLYLMVGLINLLPVDTASAFGGWCLRKVGPRLKVQRVAENNLALAMPELSDEARAHIVRDMWVHLGRIAVEFIHLPKLAKRTTLIGIEHLPAEGTPFILFSGHLGFWELIPWVTKNRGEDILVVYRHINNPAIDAWVKKQRSHFSQYFAAKGYSGAGAILRALKGKRAVGMLVDQRQNTGISVPFFGKPAMTATAIAEFALRYDIPILPVRIVRTKGAHFEAHIYPALAVHKTEDAQADVLKLMTDINATLEGWIREHPEQWFWVHKRWGKSSPL